MADDHMIVLKNTWWPWSLFMSMSVLLCCFCKPGFSEVNPPFSFQKKIEQYAGDGAVGVWDEQGTALFSLNTTKGMVPASILKIVTAAVFIHYAGSDYRFETHFYRDSKGNLFIKGMGDPSLVSEEWVKIAAALKSKGLFEVNELVLDDSFFAPLLKVPGVGQSTNPYDALNGALTTNFNTLYVTVSPRKEVISAESQTPLTIFMKQRALAVRRTGTFRIAIKQNREHALMLFASLGRAFLKQAGIMISGVDRFETVPASLKPFHVHYSSKDSAAIITDMMEYSNNFSANQLFLTAGVMAADPPATLEKAVQATQKFLHQKIGLTNITVVEGSGISRQNKISARQFHEILRYFRPYKHLLPEKDGVWSKTGTLRQVSTLAGFYIPQQNKAQLRLFVIMLQGKHHDRLKILSLLRKHY
ncbi:D-alanyl-D-alanine carboxypeptidase/D-alanyl-D-alanine-endopeptidase [candidate division CSSED10-310 bacterium]|uniref:D-alanyl-D-alanine carboxypeptidase/D-alanyl-D-alanine-endopeptidase n=1 Tax=candidate division CSSED10-310 bacterium TaxID=2855610 RepID=A0ABV6YYN2_UNCC1